ncbi:hypothetical protein [Curtobacterium flaccumfaciens]|uniref:hypothetical protein n=1 Tax=Curtobacterium flaccumfaciens TaxID=2035 RepID=UPI00265A2192|nr:hypothetical protein [Curtobacterium flaccumfaciens]MCS5507133.1 hypothetical protein [Curtobacterium flaccumfaciens pv. flaccumfaciens]
MRTRTITDGDPRDDLVPLAVAALTIRRDERTLRRWAAASFEVREIDGARFTTLRHVTAWAAEHGRRRGRTRGHPNRVALNVRPT